MEALTQTMEELARSFNIQMAQFQEDLKKASSSPETCLDTVTAISTEFTNFKLYVVANLLSLRQQVGLITRQQDQFETRSRRNMLLIHGVAESKQEDTSAVVTSICGDKLKLSDVSIRDIARSHRLGKSSGGRPRPIIVEFVSVAHRNKVWFSKTELKGSGLTISEFLTKERHEAFLAAREHFGVTKCWTRDGFIHIISSDGSKHRVSSAAEVVGIIGSGVSAAMFPNEMVAASTSVAGSVAVAGSSAAAGTSTAGQQARPKRNTRK